MRISKTNIPVVVLSCQLAALAIMRSLGSLGIPVYGVDKDAQSPGMFSRYCRRRFVADFRPARPAEFLAYLVRVREEIGRPCLLIPTSDESAEFVTHHGEELSRYFIFPKNDPATIKKLVSKKEMYHLALEYGVPTPTAIFPSNLSEVLAYRQQAVFPVMIKGIDGHRLEQRTGKRMMIVSNGDELIENYKVLAADDADNIMLQEYIPGGDDQVYIFNGYFDEQSRCLAAFTGRKIRQHPVHVGCASLGETVWVPEVAETTINFMQAIRYRGILDIGYRLDPRDGRYKVLDINPRIGQAFRLFTSENDDDVARIAYLDLTGQPMPAVTPRINRRWVIEDMDLTSSLDYRREGILTFGQWLRSFRNLEEGAWFSLRDPMPFLVMLWRVFLRSCRWLGKRLPGPVSKTRPATD
jgi:D-aspartate ligase